MGSIKVAVRISALLKLAIFAIFVKLLAAIFWPEAFCFSVNSSKPQVETLSHPDNGQTFHFRVSYNSSDTTYRVPMKLCRQVHFQNFMCDTADLSNVDRLCFGLEKYVTVWVVQSANGLLITFGWVVAYLRRPSSAGIHQVDLAIPVVILAFISSVLWLNISMIISWPNFWWNAGWSAPHCPVDERKWASAAFIIGVLDLILLTSCFNARKITKTKKE
ncbi:hypothetical protein L596_027860 [Steinernema carpocapsae]|uniref:Uncharacterized protein n=1 Tax=Steinernema carpocapsae TaxID=34508 RepID=A0A4U5LWT5_STECR|nr:hypothetical protein L596_027860 [Steinernema carpocapsae]